MRTVRIVVRQISNLGRLAVLMMPGLVAAAACDRPDWDVVDLGPGGTTTTAGTGVTAGTAIVFGGTAGQTCAFDRVVGTKPIFSAQTVNTNLPGRTELYALVSDEEAEALRAGGPLVPPVDPMVVPDVVKVLDKLLVSAITSSRRAVVQALKPRFASVRRAWPNPWALRLVDHAGSEHLNVVRLVLRSDAWIARTLDGSIDVVDTKNVKLTPDVAAADPGRIAAIIYELNQRSFVTTTGGDPCEDGRREYVISNDAMIEEWSLGTEEILARLEDDLTKLEAFFKVARNCGTMALPGGSFRTTTACTVWPSPYNVFSEFTAYQWSLSTPSELYKPSSQNLASLIEALQGDRFVATEPYVVNPEPPTGGAGGAGGGAGAPNAAAGAGN